MNHKLEVIDSTVQKTYEWLRDVREGLQIDDSHLAYQTLRAVLHTLRDRLSPEQAADLGAQLPLLVRGIYYEGWKPTGKPLKIRSQEEFFDAIMAHHHSKITLKPQRLATVVFEVIEKHVTPGEVEKVCGDLPREIRHLWPRASSR